MRAAEMSDASPDVTIADTAPLPVEPADIPEPVGIEADATDPDELETGDTDFSWLEDLEDDGPEGEPTTNDPSALHLVTEPDDPERLEFQEADPSLIEEPVRSNIVDLPAARLSREAGRLAPDEEAALDKIAQSIESAFDDDHRNPLIQDAENADEDGETSEPSEPVEADLNAGTLDALEDDDDASFEDPDAEWPPMHDDAEEPSDAAFRPEPAETVTALAAPFREASNIVQHPNAVTMAEQAALLERLPLGLIIFRDDAIAYANRAFFDLTGYSDLHSLQRAGGLDAVFLSYALPGPGDLEADAGRRTLTATRRDGSKVDVAARLQSIPLWRHHLHASVSAGSA